MEVHRGQLKNAPYNPRTLSDEQKRRLKAGITNLGMLGPITWNALSGNIVGGHQRIKVLDALNGSADYSLRVARVELADTEEMEANLLLNNEEAQGDWDLEKLLEVMKTPGLRLEAAGFDMSDLMRMGGMDALAERSESEVDAFADRLAESRERQEELTAAADTRDSADFYLVLVFKDSESTSRFLKRLKLDDNRYQDGQVILGGIEQAGLVAPAPASGEPDDA